MHEVVDDGREVRLRGTAGTVTARAAVLAVPAPVAARLHPGAPEDERAFLTACTFTPNFKISCLLDRPLGLASAQLAGALANQAGDTPPARATAEAMVHDVARRAEFGPGHALVLTDPGFTIVAASGPLRDHVGEQLDALLAGGQPLFLFGPRAGVMEVRFGNAGWRAALDFAEGRGAAVAMVSHDATLAEWRRSVSFDVTLFVMTATVLIVILYAYFGQVSRAEAADRIYLEAHQRVDLALTRGRCGLWDWDLERGRRYPRSNIGAGY